MSKEDQAVREYRRLSLRSAIQSLFWHVILTRKAEQGLTMTAVAEGLGVDKSYVSRSFSSPPNWQIDKIADLAEVLGVEISVEARDKQSGRMFNSHGNAEPVVSAYKTASPSGHVYQDKVAINTSTAPYVGFSAT